MKMMERKRSFVKLYSKLRCHSLAAPWADNTPFLHSHRLSAAFEHLGGDSWIKILPFFFYTIVAYKLKLQKTFLNILSLGKLPQQSKENLLGEIF